MTRARATDLSELARVVAISGGNCAQAAVIAEATRAPEAVRSVLKSAAGGGNLSDPAWAGSLDGYSNMVTAFVGSLASSSILGRLLADDAVTRLPLGTSAAAVVANATAFAIGAGSPIAVSSLSLASKSLQPRTAAGMVVLTSELIRSASPAARALVDASLRSAVSTAIDAAFVSIISAGITPTAATGMTAGDALADLKRLLDVVNVSGAGKLYWLMSPSVANAASTLAGPDGSNAFPAMSPSGGEMVNLPALTSSALPAGQLMLVDAASIAAEIEAVTVSLSDQAAVQMSTTPDAPPNAGTVLTSLWRQNLIAVLARCVFGAEKVRSGAVAILANIAWSA